MTLMLIALWIAGSTFKWYWLVATFVFDSLWLAIKLNFLTVLVRRSIDEAVSDIARQAVEAAKESTPPAGGPSTF